MPGAPRLERAGRRDSRGASCWLRCRSARPPECRGSPPPSRRPHDPPEVEPEGFLELGPRACLRLRVFELLEINLEGHAFPFDAVELRGEAAPLVRFREDDLGPREALVVLGDLLDGLRQEAGDRLLVRAHDGGKSRGESDVGHGALLVRFLYPTLSSPLSLGGRGSEVESTSSGPRRPRRGESRARPRGRAS